MDELKSWPERWENAVNLLNDYCTAHYIDMPGEESRKVADAINDILPFAVWAYNHPAPENKPLTVFGALTKSPEVFAEFIRKVNLGQILIDELFCNGDCGNDDCPHELQCIINWLNGPYARKPEQEATP